MNKYITPVSAATYVPKNDFLHVSGFETKETFRAGYLENEYRKEIKSQAVPASLKQFEIIWVKNGSGSLRLDFTEYKIEHNIVYCLFPGQMYRFNLDPDIFGYRISFSEEFFSHHDDQIFLPFEIDYRCRDYNIQTIRVGDGIEIEQVIKTIIWEYHNNFEFKSGILKGLLKILVAYFSRNFEGNVPAFGSDNDSRLFKNFMDLLERNYLTKKAVADYASALSVSANYLSEVSRKVSGRTASHHIQQRLVLEAKRAAVYSGSSMKEIAYRLGFMDSAQFSKFFKSKTGVNFSVYKKQPGFF